MPDRRSCLTALVAITALVLPAAAAAQDARLTVTAPASATLGQSAIFHFSGEGANNPTYPETNVYGVLLPPGNQCPADAAGAKGYYPAQDRKAIVDKPVPAHPAFEFDDDSEVIDKYAGAWVVCGYLWTGSMGSTPDATSFTTLNVVDPGAGGGGGGGGGTTPLSADLTASKQSKRKIRSSGFAFSIIANQAGKLSARVYVRSGKTKHACGAQINATYAAGGTFKRSSGKPSRRSTCARVLRKRGAKTIVVVWTYTPATGAAKGGTSAFKVT